MYDYDRRRYAMEHATPGAKKEYLRDHPNAEPKNHTVRERRDEKSSHKVKGKGGPGKQRKDWIEKLKKGFKPSSEEQGDSLRHLERAAKEVDELEKKLESGDLPESRLKTLQVKFKSYNEFLKETFGGDAAEAVPKWELPKPKESERPKAKEPEKSDSKGKSDEKSEKKPAEKKKAPRDLSRDIQKEIAKKYGIVDDVQFDHVSEDEDEWVYFVNTEKAELSVVIDRESGKVKKVQVNKDLEEDDYAAGRKKRQ